MSKLPYLPFYYIDFERDEKVQNMGAMTRYFYIAMLCHQWQEGSVPEDEQFWKRKFLTIPKDWLTDEGTEAFANASAYADALEVIFDVHSIIHQVRECFVSVENGRMINLKMKKLQDENKQKYDNRMKGIEKANEIKHKKHPAKARAKARENQNQNQNQNQIIEPKHNTGGKEKRFSPPSVKEVNDYCVQRNNKVDPQAFMDHYESNGWRVGKNPMKSWQAAVRTWEKNNERSQTGSGRGRVRDFVKEREQQDKDRYARVFSKPPCVAGDIHRKEINGNGIETLDGEIADLPDVEVG